MSGVDTKRMNSTRVAGGNREADNVTERVNQLLRQLLDATAQGSDLQVESQGPWDTNANERVQLMQEPGCDFAVQALQEVMFKCDMDAAAIQANMADMANQVSPHEQSVPTSATDQSHACAPQSSDQQSSGVTSLETERLHRLVALKAAALEYLITVTTRRMSASVMSASFIVDLKTSDPPLWRSTRAALGLPEEEDKENEEVGYREI